MRMEMFTQETSKMENHTALGRWFMLMGKITQESGKKGSETELASQYRKMEECT
jgi:hypothetical protein